MARDRKRAKQRQRKRGGQQQQQSPQQREPRPARVPDGEPVDELEPLEPLEPLDESVDPAGPLGQAAPDAELAELAETGLQEPGAPVGRPLEEKDYPHPDELEGADVIQEVEAEEAASGGGGGGRRRRRRRGGGEDGGAGEGPSDVTPPARRAAAGRELPKEGNRFVNFLRACVAELRRVQWPDRRQVGQATAVVIGFVVVAGTYLGLLDAAFSRVVDAIL
jgi:preprotein translocase subunit SecE